MPRRVRIGTLPAERPAGARHAGARPHGDRRSAARSGYHGASRAGFRVAKSIMRREVKCRSAASPPSSLARAAPAAAPRTLRLELVHAGNASEERFAATASRARGRGRATRHGRSTTRTSASTCSRCATARRTALLYSRGFASIYGEWETTEEAKQGWPRASTSRCASPSPRLRCRSAIRKRDAAGRLPRAVDGASSTRRTRRSTARPSPGAAWARRRERRRRPTRWTCCSSATATRRPRWTSGTATRGG